MIRRALLAVVLLVGVKAAWGADWRANLPADWLVAAEASSLESLERGVARLLEPWGREAPAIGKTLAALCPDVAFAPRMRGVALVVTPAGELSPVVYLPTDEYQVLCDILDADRVDDMAVANVSGYDLALVERQGWVQICLLDALPKDVEADASASATPWSVDGDLRAIVSPAGLDRVAEGLRRRRQGQLESGQGRIGPWRWPQGFDGYVDRLALYAPLAAELAATAKPLELAIEVDEDELRVSAVVLTEVLAENGSQTIQQSAPDTAIGVATLPHGMPPQLVDFAIAWMKCRPDEIDAPDYPQPQWDDLAAAYRSLLSRYRSVSVLSTLPADGEPVATNQAAAFVWDGDAASLGDALRLVVLRWNQLIDASDARMPLRIEMAPLEDAEGWRLSTDLFDGFGLERSPEVAEVFDRYYGGDVLSITVQRTPGDGIWTARYGEAPADVLAWRPADGESDLSKDVLIDAQLRVDRWFAWKALVETLDMADALGYRPREPMAESPAAKLTVTGGDGLLLETLLPTATYDAAVAHLRSR